MKLSIGLCADMVCIKDRKQYLILSCILFLTFFSFFPALKNGFTNWDDLHYLVENPDIRLLNLPHLKKIFTSTIADCYTPLTILSYAIEYHFFKLNPLIYHLDNLLLHLGVVALIFLFSLRLGASLTASALASLLFGIHPLHVESVAWITARKDVLFGLFFMCSLVNYKDYLITQKKVWFILSIIFGFLSMLAKPSALTLPLALLLLDWQAGRKDVKRAIYEKWPFILYILPLSWMTYHLNTNVLLVSRQWGEGLLIGIWTFTFYIQKFLWPITLTPAYLIPRPISILNPAYMIAVLILGVLVWGLIRFRQNRWIIFAILFYLINIFFITRFDSIALLNIVADRFMYLPSLGFCILLGVWAQKIWPRRSLWMACLGIIFAFLSVKTWDQTTIWKDSVTLWSYTIQKFPDVKDPAKHIPEDIKEDTYALADLLELNKRLGDNYVYGVIYNNRADAYKRQKQYALALDDIQKSLEFNPYYFGAFANRGMMYFSQNQHDLALADFNQAIKLNSGFDSSYTARGIIYAQRGELELALADFGRAAQLNPKNAAGYNNRGSVYFYQGRYALALADYQKALELNPEYWEVYNNRSALYDDQKLYDLADADSKAASELKKVLEKR